MNIHNSAKIHPSAIIEDGARIGENAIIEAFCVIGSSVTIGDNTTIQNHSCVYGKTTIGKNNTIFSHTVLGSIPQDLKYDGENSELIIGDNNRIREFCMINIGTKSGGNKTVIGDNNLIMSHVHIAHDCIMHNNCILASGAVLAGHIDIRDNAFIGGSSAIHQFVQVGEHSMLAGGGILTQDLPPFCLAEGNRAVLKSLNVVGLRRHMPDEVDSLKKAFKLFFRVTSKVDMKKNIEDFYKITDSKYIRSLCEFVINSNRGIPLDLAQNPGKES